MLIIPEHVKQAAPIERTDTIADQMNRVIDIVREWAADHQYIKFKPHDLEGFIDWVWSLTFKTKTEPACVIVAMIYMDQILEKRSDAITHKNAIGMVTVSMMVASKMWQDIPYTNSAWVTATDGRFSLKTLNSTELEMLEVLDWSLLHRIPLMYPLTK